MPSSFTWVSSKDWSSVSVYSSYFTSRHRSTGTTSVSPSNCVCVCGRVCEVCGLSYWYYLVRHIGNGCHGSVLMHLKLLLIQVMWFRMSAKQTKLWYYIITRTHVHFSNLLYIVTSRTPVFLSLFLPSFSPPLFARECAEEDCLQSSNLERVK